MAEHKILIDDCEDAWDESVAAGVTSVADAVDYKVGAASAKISPDATVAAGTILATEAMAPVDISDCQKVRLWIKSSVDIELGDLQILLDNHASCASPEETLDVPALSAGVWSLCDLPLANPESDTAIRSVGLKYITDLEACDIWVDDVNGCIVTPNYAEVLTRGWYPALDKTVPFKVDENGVQEVYDPKVFAQIDKLAGNEADTQVAALDLAAGPTEVFTISTTTRKKVHMLMVSMVNCAAAAKVTVDLSTKISGAMTKFYSQVFTKDTDPDGIMAINGTLAILADLKVEMTSSDAGDTSVTVPYSYILEDME